MAPTPLGHVLDRLAEEMPEYGQIPLRAAARLIALIDADRLQQAKPQPQPEIVRVMRVYIFEGERDRIEEQLSRSLGDGTKVFDYPRGGGLKHTPTKIHVATIGAFPEVMRLG